jgi:hypothetical protein
VTADPAVLMRILLRIVLFFVICLVALPCIFEASTLVETHCGEVYATLSFAVLLAGCGFLFEYAIAGRAEWYLAAVLPAVATVRYVLWSLVGIVADVGVIGFFRIGPNPLAEIVISDVAFVLVITIVNIVRHRHRSQEL